MRLISVFLYNGFYHSLQLQVLLAGWLFGASNRIQLAHMVSYLSDSHLMVTEHATAVYR